MKACGGVVGRYRTESSVGEGGLLGSFGVHRETLPATGARSAALRRLLAVLRVPSDPYQASPCMPSLTPGLRRGPPLMDDLPLVA